MEADLSIISLFLNASLTVKLVMLLLLAASIFSWGIIFQRRNKISLAEKEMNEFEKSFWSGLDLTQLYQRITLQKESPTVGEQLFLIGFQEYNRLKKIQSMSPEVVVMTVNKVMRTTAEKSISSLEKNISWLATIQSVSPYIGLFGTVWGIMSSFRALGSVTQASLQMVAPGISEALVATAIGLVAAIPAGIFYNRFSHRLDILSHKYEMFIDEFTNLVQKRVYAPNKVDQTLVPDATTSEVNA